MKLYTSNYLSQSISVIDYDTLTLEKEIRLEDNICPHHFCIEKEKNLMYLPSACDGVLYVLDIKTDEIVDSVSIGGNLSQISMYKDEIFVANEDSNSVYIVDKENLQPNGMISVDNMPHGFESDKLDNRLYVPCIDSIICIDIGSTSIERKISIDMKAWHIKVDEQKNYIYTSTLDGKIVVLEKRKLNIKHVIDEFLIPVEICINYKNGLIYVADLGYKTIKILNYDTYEMCGCIDIKGNPQGLEISKDGMRLFVTDTFNNSVKVYDTSNNKLIKEIKVGKEPTTILFV